MKLIRLLQVSLAGAALALSCGSAWAVLITESPKTGTNVGSVDTLIAYGRTSNSDLSTEIDFVNYFAGTSYTTASSEKLCDSSAECDAIIFATNQAGVFAISLPEEPEYFLLKTGAKSDLTRSQSPYNCDGSNGPGGDDCDHFLFQNLASTAWGVFDFAAMGFGSITSITKISHVDQFGGTPPTTVPEPGTISLLGAGLLALGTLRRRAARA